MVDDNNSPGSPDKNRSPNPDGNASPESDAAIDVLARKDIGNASLAEGPIEQPAPLSEVKQEPYNLPNLYEWITCDIDSEETCMEVYNLLTNNYVEDDENMFRFNYSKEFLRWALRPPARIRVRDDIVTMAEINFLCVHKKLRSKRLAPVMIKEVTRRVHLENIWQAAYTAGVVLPTPISTCQYWHRSLNPKKLIDVGFSRLGARMTMSRTIKLYKLPDSTVTPGFRQMELHDVPAVTRLLRNYLSQFAVAVDLDENDVEHWLLPTENVVDSYLVESPETHEITDFCSFYTLPSTILGNQNYSTLKAAYSYYNVSTKTPLLQLMNDALIVAKRKDYDVFNALDVMQNETFLKELKFGPGDGKTSLLSLQLSLKKSIETIRAWACTLIVLSSKFTLRRGPFGSIFVIFCDLLLVVCSMLIMSPLSGMVLMRMFKSCQKLIDISMMTFEISCFYWETLIVNTTQSYMFGTWE
ncbi:Glycylpeptide N-tetradecanoyltransferase 1 [Vitis vinifera]|uniref:Glycylpeptide N-tetradecanoyltransferase n=1 Tax=Vitis vinifera TaxID=29760 RepID=A0A438EWM4_VITVI|nr:Glycylpeptide N-tetradecanoyltransferase 1 [Vitis vinifera]